MPPAVLDKLDLELEICPAADADMELFDELREEEYLVRFGIGCFVNRYFPLAEIIAQYNKLDPMLGKYLLKLLSDCPLSIGTPEMIYERRMQRGKFIFFAALAVIVILLGIKIAGSRGRDNAIAGLPAPVQGEASGGTDLKIGKDDVQISYIATYDIDALVVSTHDYPGTDIGNKLVPRDIALAWGKVAEYNTKVDFNWSQSGRFCRYTLNRDDYQTVLQCCPNYESEISNNHLIASDSSIRSKIKKIRRGDHVRIKGYLVNITVQIANNRTFYWNSSTSRSDTGNGACELIYVTSIDWK